MDSNNSLILDIKDKVIILNEYIKELFGENMPTKFILQDVDIGLEIQIPVCEMQNY